MCSKPVLTTVSDKAAPSSRSRPPPFPVQCRIGSKCRTLPTSRPGRGLSTWPLLTTPMPAGSPVGEPGGRHMRASCWMHRSRRYMIAGQSMAAVWSIIVTAGRKTCRLSVQSARPKSGSSRPSAASSTATTTLGRDGQRPLQGRDHLPARAVAQLRGSRILHPRVARLFQPLPATQTHLQHLACCSRRAFYTVADRIGVAAWLTTQRLRQTRGVQSNIRCNVNAILACRLSARRS